MMVETEDPAVAAGREFAEAYKDDLGAYCALGDLEEDLLSRRPYYCTFSRAAVQRMTPSELEAATHRNLFPMTAA